MRLINSFSFKGMFWVTIHDRWRKREHVVVRHIWYLSVPLTVPQYFRKRGENSSQRKRRRRKLCLVVKEICLFLIWLILVDLELSLMAGFSSPRAGVDLMPRITSVLPQAKSFQPIKPLCTMWNMPKRQKFPFTHRTLMLIIHQEREKVARVLRPMFVHQRPEEKFQAKGQRLHRQLLSSFPQMLVRSQFRSLE